MDCEMCRIRETMEKIRAMLDELPEINAFYDEPVTEIYNAVDNAAHLFRDYHWQEAQETEKELTHAI